MKKLDLVYLIADAEGNLFVDDFYNGVKANESRGTWTYEEKAYNINDSHFNDNPHLEAGVSFGFLMTPKKLIASDIVGVYRRDNEGLCRLVSDASDIAILNSRFLR